jgi:hypothetical protein
MFCYYYSLKNRIPPMLRLQNVLHRSKVKNRIPPIEASECSVITNKDFKVKNRIPPIEASQNVLLLLQ